MGGFTLNGCGARDYIKKLKYLGNKMCPHCKKVQPFYLVSAKFKISVFFIPTVTLNEKYAIMCDCCKNGEIIEESEMHRIMASEDAVQNTIAGGPAAETPALPAAEPEKQSTLGKICKNCGAPLSSNICGICGANNQEALPDKSQNIETDGRVCPNCGSAMEGPFCGICGTRYSDQENQPDTIPAYNNKSICPNCGAEVIGNFCGICGTKRTEEKKQPDTMAPEIKINICPNCGAEVIGNFCGICGTNCKSTPEGSSVSKSNVISGSIKIDKQEYEKSGDTADDTAYKTCDPQDMSTFPEKEKNPAVNPTDKERAKSFFYCPDMKKTEDKAPSVFSKPNSFASTQQVCPNCGRKIDGKFCGFCGTKCS